jgi:hypothetical protein
MKITLTVFIAFIAFNYAQCQILFKMNFPITKELRYEKILYNLEKDSTFPVRQSITIKYKGNYGEWQYGESQFSYDSLEYLRNRFVSSSVFLNKQWIKYELDENGKILRILNHDDIVQKMKDNIDDFIMRLPESTGKRLKEVKKQLMNDLHNQKIVDDFLSDIFTYHRIYGKEIKLDQPVVEDYWNISEHTNIKKVIYTWNVNNKKTWKANLELIDVNSKIIVKKEYVFNALQHWINSYNSIDQNKKIEIRLIE